MKKHDGFLFVKTIFLYFKEYRENFVIFIDLDSEPNWKGGKHHSG